MFQDGNAWTRLTDGGQSELPNGAMIAADDHVGAFLDPEHASDIASSSLSGMRFFSEDPPHVMTVVGTDDGTTWFTLTGVCTGPDMQQLTLDFTAKGGPAKLEGTWVAGGPASAGGSIVPGQIMWPDGNRWSRIYNQGMAPPSSVAMKPGTEPASIASPYGSQLSSSLMPVSMLGMAAAALAVARYASRAYVLADPAAQNTAVLH